MASTKSDGVRAAAIAEAVDELGALEARLLPFRADFLRIEQLRKVLRAEFDGALASGIFEARGDRYTCVVGARALERSINPAKLIKRIGLKAYAAICRPTLAALEANASAETVANVVTAAHTGTRPLKTFARAAQ